MKNDKTILDEIIEGMRIVETENRNVKKIVLGADSIMELQMDFNDVMMAYGEIRTSNEMKLFGYPINILPFLPHNYIGLEL